MNKDKLLTNIVVVNYNNWEDTIVCLNSILNTTNLSYRVIIVDNFSSDDSIDRIENWGYNRLNNSIDFHGDRKKMEFKTFEANNDEFVEEKFTHILVKSNRNGGFAYANNLGAYVSKLFNINNSYLWFLNNDTKINDRTLDALIDYFNSDNYGLIGSLILDYDKPHAIQAYCGNLNKWTANTKVITNQLSIKKTDHIYPVGASLFTTSEIYSTVGGMDESYFLYYEELDLSKKILSNGYKLGISIDSHVYHKQGATTKSKKNQKKTNLAMEGYKYRGLLRFYRKNYPKLTIISILNLFLKSFKRMMRLEFKHSFYILKQIFTSK